MPFNEEGVSWPRSGHHYWQSACQTTVKYYGSIFGKPNRLAPTLTAVASQLWRPTRLATLAEANPLRAPLRSALANHCPAHAPLVLARRLLRRAPRAAALRPYRFEANPPRVSLAPLAKPAPRRCGRCVSPRARSTHNREGAFLWWRLASGRRAPLRSLVRAARPSSPRAPCGRGSLRFVGAFASRSRLRRCAFRPARRPSPLSPPSRFALLPPLRSLRSLPGGSVLPPLCYWLRSARAVGCRSVRPLLPAPSPTNPCRKVAPPLPPRSAAQPPLKKRSSGGRTAPVLVAS